MLSFTGLTPVMKHPIPLGLYIHTPWCVRKCPYCDFNSHTVRGEIPEKDYINALLTDLQHDLSLVDDRQVDSVFIGGGTPSLLSPEAYGRLFEGLQKTLSFSDTIEITLEANPGTVEYQKFSEFRSLGINRLSIGIQSFNDDMLTRLGRIHGKKEAIAAAEAAHDAGFDNFNLDLMYGLPQQTTEQALQDLDTARALEPSHLSWYQLTLEPNTLFYQQPPTLPTDDLLWDIQQQGQAFIQQAGYQQYEISAYSRQQPCRHNLNYWQFGDYLGIGAGAHSKLSNPDASHIQRRQRCRHPDDYLTKAASMDVISQSQSLTDDEKILEFMMNALRLTDGVSTEIFIQRTGLPLEMIQNKVGQAVDSGLLIASDTHIRPSEQGLRYLNNLLEVFL